VTPSALSLMMQEGSVPFASTNDPDTLDPALRRPGRFDVKISFSHATTIQAATIFQHFYALPSESQSLGRAGFSTQEDLERAARVFAESLDVGNLEISVAAIQGFLLFHKNDPQSAQEKVGDWLVELRREQSQGPESRGVNEKADARKPLLNPMGITR
jgi:chaperone BCS1